MEIALSVLTRAGVPPALPKSQSRPFTIVSAFGIRAQCSSAMDLRHLSRGRPMACGWSRHGQAQCRDWTPLTLIPNEDYPWRTRLLRGRRPSARAAQPHMEGSTVLGVVGGTPEQPRLAYLAEPRPVTEDLLALAAPVLPTAIFRFGAPCAGPRLPAFRRRRIVASPRVSSSCCPQSWTGCPRAISGQTAAGGSKRAKRPASAARRSSRTSAIPPNYIAWPQTPIRRQIARPKARPLSSPMRTSHRSVVHPRSRLPRGGLGGRGFV